MASSVFIDLDQASQQPASLIPTADNTYDLGSATFQWRTAYLGTSLILANAGLAQFGTTTPPVLQREAASHLIDRNGTTAQRFSVANTWTSTTNNELFSVDWQTQANVVLVGARTAAAGTQRVVRLVSQATNGADNYASVTLQQTFPFIRIDRTTGAGGGISEVAAGNFFIIGGNTTSTATSGTLNYLSVTPTYNQASGTAANTDLLINRTQTAVGSGAQLLIDAQVSTVSKFSVSNTGLIQTNGAQLGYNVSAYAVGTAYSLTNTAAAIDVGTTDPAIVLDKAGTYLITGQVNLAYTGATVATETATIKVRRTNNTAADLSAVVVLDLPVSTVLTHTYGIFQIPPFVYTTSATNDAVTLFANVSAALSAGTIDATAIGTSLVAVRLY